MGSPRYPRVCSAVAAGGIQTDDLILCAHNYASHFGDIGSLKPGALISVTDVNGIVTNYEVVEVVILPGDAKEEMKSGGYSLTLFTCTYGGKSRVTVYCDRVF